MKHTGFTLVELLVAMLLFAVLMTIAGSAFVYGLDLQRRAQNLQATGENATFIFETMLKEIRVSEISPAVEDSNCPAAPDEQLTVMHPDLGVIMYERQGTDLMRNGVAINSNTVEFTRLGFCISGAEAGDERQPRITISASVKSTKTKQQSFIDLQTSISPRTLND